MARKAELKPEQVTPILCRGGASYHCRHVVEEPGKDSRELGPHEARRPIRCRICKTYMGCFWCAQRPAELVCLRCNDWAMEEGEKEHGRMVRDKEAGMEALKIIRMIGEGKLSVDNALDLIAETIPGSTKYIPEFKADWKRFQDVKAERLKKQTAAHELIHSEA